MDVDEYLLPELRKVYNERLYYGSHHHDEECSRMLKACFVVSSFAHSYRPFIDPLDCTSSQQVCVFSIKKPLTLENSLTPRLLDTPFSLTDGVTVKLFSRLRGKAEQAI